jgi:hypothetical protein
VICVKSKAESKRKGKLAIFFHQIRSQEIGFSRAGYVIRQVKTIFEAESEPFKKPNNESLIRNLHQ